MACSHGSSAQPASDAAACIALAAKDCRASPTCKFAGKQCINKAAQVEEEILAPTEKSVPAVDICIVLNAQVCRAAPGCSFTAGVCHGKGRAPLTTTTTTTTTLGCLRRYLGPLLNTKAKNKFLIGGGSNLQTVQHCAALCTSVDGCNSFTYRAAKKLCRLYSTSK
eukprot:gene18881-14217_t